MSAGQCVAKEGAVQTAGDVCGTWQNEGVENICITSHTWGQKAKQTITEGSAFDSADKTRGRDGTP